MSDLDADLVVEPDAAALAERIAAELATWAHSHARQPAHLGLTGGTIANQAYAALARRGLRAIDTEELHLWWGDERFVAERDDDRNFLQAMNELLPAIPLVGEQVHPMPSSQDVETAAEAAGQYAAELGDTVLDLCLLGLGPDGHVASIFPGFDDPADASVIGVEGSPKPPPSRVSLTTARLRTSREVWFLVAGEEKADALARVYTGDAQLPGGRVRGVERTRWLLDEAAASRLPRT